MASGRINIAYAFDERIWREFMVSLYSLLINRGGLHYDIYIVVPNTITREIKSEIESFAHGIDKGSAIRWLKPSYYFGKMRFNRWGPIAYERLTLPEMLPGVNKIIYLDAGDTLVMKPLDEFYAARLDGSCFGGVVDEGFVHNPKDQSEDPFWRDNNMARMCKRRKYVNSGVLLINMKALRKDRVCEKFKKAFDDFKVEDQHLLNFVCKNKVKILPGKFNQFAGCEPYVGGRTIYHYVWGRKPSVCTFDDFQKYESIQVWWEYAMKTPHAMYLLKKMMQFDQEDRIRRYPYPKWLIYFACMFIPKRKKRARLKERWVRRI